MLTKSNYLSGLQCPKLLWITKNDKDRIPKPTKVERAKLNEGNIVGEFAKKLFPLGIDLSNLNFKENIRKTKELLKERKVLFEAGFLFKELFSRADILVPVEEDRWDIVEVKSGTKVKDLNIHDISFQKYVYEKCGLKIRNCILMHINSEYIKMGQIEPNELLMETDITEKVMEFIEGIEQRILEMLKIIKGEEPEFSVDDLLTIEYDNFVKDEFMNSLPENNIFDFVRILKKKAVPLYKEGIVKIVDTPNSFKLNDKQKIQKYVAENGEKHIDKKEIKKFLDNSQYPIYYFDFETINSATPKFDNSRPYQQIPFQFSLHIQYKPNGKLKHISFLAEGKEDPRPALLKSLKENLGDKGDILVYNQSFEKKVLKELAEFFPEYSKLIEENFLPRIKDLMDVFSKFHYYNSKQRGSVSIKKVLPLFSDLKYDGMEIAKGDVASFEFERVTYGYVSDEERQKVREALEKYCELDTLAEVEILKSLREIIKRGNFIIERWQQK